MQTLFVGRPCQHHNRDHLAKNSPAEDRVSCAISCAMGFRAGKRPTFFSISVSIDLTNTYFNQIKGLLSKVIECCLDTKVKIGFLKHQQYNSSPCWLDHSSTPAPHAPVLVPKRQRCHPWIGRIGAVKPTLSRKCDKHLSICICSSVPEIFKFTLYPIITF